MADFYKVLVQSEVLLSSESSEENELSNLVTSLMIESVPSADFVIINSGGLRTVWYPGYILEQNFYNMFPFDNYLISFDILGSELIAMQTVIQAGALGFYPSAGLRVTVSEKGRSDHKFVNATLYNGDPIVLDKMYRGLSIDFLLQGGDDFKGVINKVYTVRNAKNEGVIRDLIRPELEALKLIREGSLIDPDHPRLIVIPG